MLELWTIEHAPTAGDPRRHTLWLKGQLADVQAIIRRFGSLCGRPQKERANADYNFSLSLHAADSDALRKVQNWLTDLGPAAAERPAASPPVAAQPQPAVAVEPSPFAAADVPLEAIPELAPPAARPAMSPFTDLLAIPAAEAPVPAPTPVPAEMPVFAPPPPSEVAPMVGGVTPSEPGAQGGDAHAAPSPMSAFADLMPRPGAAQPEAQTPPPVALPPVATPPPFGAQMAPSDPFAALAQSPGQPAPEQAAGGVPPLNEAPAWPGAVIVDRAGAAEAPSPFGAPSDTFSPFGNLPPAPSMFPGLAPEPAPAPIPAPAPSPVVEAPPPAALRADGSDARRTAGAENGSPPAAAPAPAREPAYAAPAPLSAGPVSVKALIGSGGDEPLFGAAIPLNAAFTMDTLQVGSFNRFSHAASMSVVANPGSMYNPLFLFGSPGVGKTHLLSAIGRQLQEASPNDPIFLTTGPRLARAVARAKAAGRFGEIEAFAKKAKALLIDDVHVLAINEQNQDALAGLLGGFFSSTRQVVMTSVYPPRTLGALEEALKFQISAGWSVDMKPLTLEIQKEIVGPALSRNGFDVDAQTLESVVPKLEGSFFELTRWIERLKALLDLRAVNRQPSSMQDLLPILLMPDVPATTPMTSEEVQAALTDMPKPDGRGDAIPVAIFYPQGREEHGEFLVRQFHSVMKQNNWAIQLRPVHSQAYDPEQLYGVPFTMMDACAASGARAAVVLGPNPGSGLAAREPEMQHAVQHLLEGLDLRVGWVSFLRIKEAVAEDKELRLRVVGAGSVVGDRLMIRRAISNLLSNALRHAHPRTDVELAIVLKGDGINLCLTNTGDPIDALDLPRLFDRFYRVDKARAHPASDGAGLGLAITKAIMLAHGGSVAVSSVAGRTQFCLLFVSQR